MADSQFPFEGEADRANALALELLLFARDLIPGLVPIYGVDAPIWRTGKGKLIGTICAPAIGELAVMPEIRDRDGAELRKRLTALVMRANPIAVFDNISQVVKGSELAAMLTAARWQDRILGQSRLINLPVRHVWVLAGNNRSSAAKSYYAASGSNSTLTILTLKIVCSTSRANCQSMRSNIAPNLRAPASS